MLQALKTTESTPLDSIDIATAVEAACRRIAPSWPLDRFIAVNPFWEFTERAFPEVSADLAALSGARLVMPRRWYREERRAGRLDEAALREAIAESGSPRTYERFLELLEEESPSTPRRALVTDVVDARRDLGHAMSWRDFVIHNLSQFCAAYFDEGQAQLGPDPTGGLYASWRRFALQDRSPSRLMGFRAYRDRVRRLPSDPRGLIEGALTTLQIPSAEREAYLIALLLDVNGWAGWCAYRKWTARLAGGDDHHLVDLLAMRLAWEWLLLEEAGQELTAPWQIAMAAWPAVDRSARITQADDWVFQRAVELSYQHALARNLESASEAGSRAMPVAGARPGRAAEAPATPAMQAVFCIDVRSEPFRRALEAQDAGIRTLGFAGFFGIPVDYHPTGSVAARPQLPGLLAPRFRVSDAGCSPELGRRRTGRLDLGSAWKKLKTGSVSGFSFVEALGLFYLGKLVSDGLGWTRPVGAADRAGLLPGEHAGRKPRLKGTVDGRTLTSEERCDLAAGVLRAMSLTGEFAPLVVLVGHGSETVNNPHAAGLDCGACCGQTGEVNARAVAALLNEVDVRRGLESRGIRIPETTHFLPGLHNTTTDEVDLFDLDEAPAGHADRIEIARTWFGEAGRRARRARAGNLGVSTDPASPVEAAIRGRARDWSQVRPEWGLANNAAFIVAPRTRTRDLDLEGRAFLHDYRWELDDDFSVLELIMTAPMLVTHWINLQYYASTVDNLRYGSGNKTLHNVVGGHLGVFEGNGGDLRIGLPLQSIHDGTRWMHSPLRLSVFIEAPQSAIEGILDRHPGVRDLVENEWIHLFRIDEHHGAVFARRNRGWQPATGAVLEMKAR